jgi:hypothetical protein
LSFLIKGGGKVIAKGKTAYANLKEMSYISPKGNVGVRVKFAQANEPYVGARQDMASQKYPADWWTEVSRASEASKLTDIMLRSTIKAPATAKTRSEAMILSEVRTGQRDVITAPNTVRKAFIRELAAQEGITKTDKFMTRAFPYDNFYYPMRSGRPVQDAAYFQRQYVVMNRGSYLAGLRQLGYNTAGAIPLRGSTYGVEPLGYTQAMRVYLAQQMARNIAAKRQFFIMEKAPGSGINPLSASKPAQVKPSVSKGYTEVTDNIGRVQLVRMAPLKQVTLQKVNVKQKAIPKMFTVQAQAQKQQQVQILEQVAVQKPAQTMDLVVGQASIQKQGLNQILGLKQEQTQRTLQKQVLLQQTVQKQKQGQITGQQQILIQEPVPRQAQKQQQLLGSVQILKQETIQEQEQLQKPKTVQILKIEQIPKQRVIQRTKQIIEEVVIPKKTKPSKMYEPRMNSIGRTKPSKGFRAFARRGGKWRAISGSVTKESALDIGAGYVQGGLAASFKIAPINEAPAKSVSTGMFQKFADSFRSYEIRKGIARPTPNQYIEKRGTRLSTRSERGAIRQAKQNKQVKTKWL